MSNVIKSIVNTMVEYQEIHNIKKECVTNVQILYDIIKETDPSLDVKIKAVIVVSHDNENNTHLCVTGHLVLSIDDENVIDPSYEIASLKNSYYFTNIKDYIQSFNNTYDKKEQIEIFSKGGGLANIIQEHLKFVNIADGMNNNKFRINKEYYNNICQYIQVKHKHELLMFTSNSLLDNLYKLIYN
jgi:hypothetical protein